MELNKKTTDMLIAKMKANPDRGSKCSGCETTAKDCQIKYLESGCTEWCCQQCKELGAAKLHTRRRA